MLLLPFRLKIDYLSVVEHLYSTIIYLLIYFTDIYRTLPFTHAPVKLFYPHPPRAPPGTSLFLVARVSSSLNFCLAPPYVNTITTLFSSAPPFFITHVFSLTPGLPGRGIGAEQFDRPIIVCLYNFIRFHIQEYTL